MGSRGGRRATARPGGAPHGVRRARGDPRGARGEHARGGGEGPRLRQGPRGRGLFVTLSRREFLGAVAASPLALPRRSAGGAKAGTDIRIDEVRHSYQDYVYRTPYKFGARAADPVTLLTVRSP